LRAQCRPLSGQGHGGDDRIFAEFEVWKACPNIGRWGDYSKHCWNGDRVVGLNSGLAQ